VAHKHASVLDLGTGSGAVALAVASERPNTTVTATDISMAALEVAKRNAARLQLPVQFFESDWYERLSATRFDLIVSNPPYIAAGDPDLDPAVLSSEPVNALIAGPTGLEAIQTIVKGAREFLCPAGWLVLEHGWRQGAAVRELLVAAGFDGVASHADLAGNERVTEGQWLQQRP
jgi:release factor glutamine methyltransferase